VKLADGLNHAPRVAPVVNRRRRDRAVPHRLRHRRDILTRFERSRAVWASKRREVSILRTSAWDRILYWTTSPLNRRPPRPASLPSPVP